MDDKDNRDSGTAAVCCLTLLLFLTLGCASGAQRPAGIAAPLIDGYQVGVIFFGSGQSAPVTIEVDITNQASQPITVRRIDVASPAMNFYSLLPTTRDFAERIEPGERKTIPIHATAVTSVQNPSEPLSVRIVVELEVNEARWREIVNEPLIPQR